MAMTMPRQRGSVNSETKQTEKKSEDEDYSPIANGKQHYKNAERRNVEEVYNPQPNNQSKAQKREYFIKNACYSVTKYYLCRQLLCLHQLTIEAYK